MGTAGNTIDPERHPTDDSEKAAARLGEELDSAISRLPRRGRDALVLRFFADKSFKDVGTELGISEEAAKQRVFRSLETLREMLSARGVRVPAGVLAAMLPAAAIRPAPPALAAAAKLAAGKTAAAAGPAAIAKGAMLIMIWTKAKAVVTAAAVGILVGGTSVVLVYHLVRDRDEIVATTASAIRRVDFQANQQVTDSRRPGVAYSHSIAQGRVAIQVEYAPGRQAGRAPYQKVAPPSADDAGTHATFSVVAGSLPDVATTGSSDPLRCLNDGKMPADEDSPNDNFRFAIGTGEGRVKADLGRTLAIAQINTYSWHTDTRAPQYYRVYGSNGDSPGFDPSPGVEREPASCGWEQIASVDTRPSPMQNSSGGRYAVGISSPTGQIGRYRYLLFVMLPTETQDGCGHTFYSEIDIVEKK